ncbi:YdcF family protein [Agrilactobacillus fermenti]|uniref:YdcF family protein n=1 Tax=Agrilactobacillus fermenti TaxID=2586909 RepID=UPI003A5BCA40
MNSNATDIVIMTIYALPLVGLTIFLGSWFTEKRRLINGVWFNLFLLLLAADAVLFVFQTRNSIVTGIAVLLAVVVFGLIFLLFFSMVFLLLWNARIVWKREAHTLANSLTLLLAIGWIVLWVINLLPTAKFLPQWLNQILAILPLIIFYLLASFYNYLTNLVLYQFNRPRLNQDYIIVLGAGLLNGNQVSPLLAQRIQRAIAFYHKQKAKIGRAPKLVFSGGRGGDETIAEGLAMQDYAVAHGVPRTDTLAETASKTTFENMKFSKAVIVKDSGQTSSQSHIIFVSNNYHTFRAGLYARMAGLPANGIGSKTSKYFLPNAIIREYLAIFAMKKKQHLWVIGLIFGFDIIATIGAQIIQIIVNR